MRLSIGYVAFTVALAYGGYRLFELIVLNLGILGLAAMWLPAALLLVQIFRRILQSRDVIEKEAIHIVTTFVLLKGKRRSGLTVMPGANFACLLRLVLTRRLYSEVIQPQVSDHAIEFQDAVVAGNDRHANWIRFRCNLLLAWAVFLIIPGSVVGVVLKFWKPTR
jgi:hypothetical protein